MANPVYILTGQTASGKTTALLQWCALHHAAGILSPLVYGKRMLFDIARAEFFPFEADPGTAATIAIGRYHFYQEAFQKGGQVLMEGAARAGWLVLDEAGPLELRGEGFSSYLKKILRSPLEGSRLLIVVRQSLVASFEEKFCLQHTVVIEKQDLAQLV